MNSRPIVRHGQSLAALRRVIKATGARSVFWNQRYEPMIADRDHWIASEWVRDEVTVRIFNGSLLLEPEAIKTKAGQPYKVFTPFWRECLSLGDPAEPLPAPKMIPKPPSWPGSNSLENLALLPKVDWADGIHRTWSPGEKGAEQELKSVLANSIMDHASGRDRPDRQGTSHLSPYLHHGEISPRQVWHAVMRREQLDNQAGVIQNCRAFLRQICWREFAYHQLHHFPHTVNRPLRETFTGFPWRMDRKGLQAWKQGRTGYPAADAAMRELW